MATTGRPSKLDDARLEQIRQAVRLGLSQREAAAACGVSEATWKNWKARARSCAKIRDKAPGELLLAELQDLARDLGLKPSRIEGTGKGGRVLKADIAAAVASKAEYYLAFLAELDAAEPYAKAALLGSLELLVKGGRVITDVDEHGRVVRRGVRSSQVITKKRRTEVTCAETGATVVEWVPFEVVEVVNERELAPSRMAVQRMLEMRWPEEFGRRKAIDPGAGETEDQRALRIVQSARAMFGTVPPPPELTEGDPTADVLAQIENMSDEEVAAALEEMGAAE